MKKKFKKTILVVIGLGFAFILIALLYRDYRPEVNLLLHPTDNTQEKLLILIRQHELRDSIFLLGLIAILNAIPGLSNSLICILAGLCYGPWIGFLINWIGNIIGNSIILSLIEKIDFSHRFKENKILKFLLQQNNPLLGLSIGFMIPFIPSVLVNYACANMKLSIKKYLPIVLFGMLPTSYLYAFGGDAIFKGDMSRIIGVVIVILVLFVMAIFLVNLASKEHHQVN
ncbi:putative membrane protein YdjX (TVP38/TMEM64 family) [Lactobacillus colini]|uniref:TVP38/TMEM64 family membrane protein n=1 Tax=Lactobacillus colini TaxID=1819254 RepID=A0ABS4MED6_9LACO|nr:VTT domain-containing protein [Lactobacillus colini]MBP2058045.1 putative membrane protein YdjX (TVP38/TMEM64 family) [Lactobacillus colini]